MLIVGWNNHKLPVFNNRLMVRDVTPRLQISVAVVNKQKRYVSRPAICLRWNFNNFKLSTESAPQTCIAWVTRFTVRSPTEIRQTLPLSRYWFPQMLPNTSLLLNRFLVLHKNECMRNHHQEQQLKSFVSKWGTPVLHKIKWVYKQ